MQLASLVNEFVSLFKSDEPLAVVLGMNVLQLRTRQRLSKTAFARMSGISRPTLNKIERGASDVRLSCLQRMADALCVDPLLLLIASDGERDRRLRL